MKTEIDARVMSIEDARRVTERIRIQATNVRDGMEKLQEHVDAAKAGKAWEVLGYKSWTAYLADVMGEEPLRLSRDDRREAVKFLAGEGMSTRAIAPIVGVSKDSVHRDLQVSHHETPASAPSAPSPEDSSDSLTPAPDSVTGLDGKTYTRPSPSPSERPRRNPLPDTFTSALLDVQRRLKTMRDLTTDNRWPANKNQVATMHGSDLERINDLLQEIRQSVSN